MRSQPRLAGLRLAIAFYFVTQRNDLQVLGTIGPVVLPTHNQVAAIHGMPVVAEAAAFELEFDGDGLPDSGPDEALGVAVGEGGLESLDEEAKLAGKHAEKEDDTMLVGRGVTQCAEVNREAAGRAAGEALRTLTRLDFTVAVSGGA